MFDFQPELSGDLIKMRPMTKADCEDLFAKASDPLIWEMHPAHDRWRREVFQKFVDDAFADKGGLVAIEHETGKIVGFSRYSQKYVGAQEMEIGWTFLSRHLWGGTHNRDMKRVMLAHALESYPRVIFRIGEDNARSRRAIEKIGGTLIEWSEFVEMADRRVRYVAYAISRDRFTSGLLCNDN